MDRTLYNASGCKDKTAHDAICSASKSQTQVFRIISGNPRQFNYRDESAGLCISAQKI